MKNAPVYGIDAADKALRLAVLLHQEGPLRVVEVAQRLDVARSTAHRLLAVLVYRDFAEQQPDRRYGAGPVLRQAAAPEPVARLRAVAVPHLRALVAATGETAQLTTRVGTEIRFVATVECNEVLRVGDREGRTLPAHLASGGLVMLAALPRTEVAALYPDAAEPDRAALARLLGRVRRQGFAVNDQDTEAGVTAIGRAVTATGGTPTAAVSLAMPTVRYSRARLPEWVRRLASTAAGIELDLRTR